MSGSLLSIGKTGLFAAQAALTTTGHNITNANVDGYSRQGVVQANATTIERGYGFVGTGTRIAEIKRYSDDFLNNQVRNATASKSSLDAYYSQVSQIDNLLADSSSGLSPVLQDFFAAVQNVSGNGASAASRQALLSAGATLAGSFQQVDKRLEEIDTGVNQQIESNVHVINTYAKEIAALNLKIGGLGALPNRQPNDLLDQRDQLVMELNKHVKATVTAGSNNALNVSIGNGQPLVVGTQPFQLAAMRSPTDLSRVNVGYLTGGKELPLPESALSGGELGGLLEFRTNTLDRVQNAIGRLALGLATTFNTQHQLGTNSTGQRGGNFFAAAPVSVSPAVGNSTGAAIVNAEISDLAKLGDSDFRVESDGTGFYLTRLRDNFREQIPTAPDGSARIERDGVTFTVTGSPTSGDNYLVRPTANAAAQFRLALTDINQVAAAAPVATAALDSNKGNATISSGNVSAEFFAGDPGLPLTLRYNKDAATLSGFADGATVLVTVGGVSTPHTATGGVVPFTAGATYSVNGVSATISGTPGDGDGFTISNNKSGNVDTRNMAALAALQTRNVFHNGTATFQSSFAQTVSAVGNKTREVQVSANAGEALLKEVQGAAQNVSGVNLDEEAANLLKYQQAYQAAGKVMQVANGLFDTLLSLAR